MRMIVLCIKYDSRRSHDEYFIGKYSYFLHFVPFCFCTLSGNGKFSNASMLATACTESIRYFM